ncbi:hypothetical protein QWZ10_01415 [Paracoccus cavernae]|uniref:Uncharacterized protein n=1 Tax=Paracoccus cavernae TaxID=1571207 RepID=A0ABT8D208_9RHOB|nr:hypothetical protein [Paracoccus cavernae]
MIKRFEKEMVAPTLGAGPAIALIAENIALPAEGFGLGNGAGNVIGGIADIVVDGEDDIVGFGREPELARILHVAIGDDSRDPLVFGQIARHLVVIVEHNEKVVDLRQNRIDDLAQDPAARRKSGEMGADHRLAHPGWS